MSEWANYISNYRKTNNLTKTQLSKKIKFSVMTISGWERDKFSPNLSVERRVREFLDVGL